MSETIKTINACIDRLRLLKKFLQDHPEYEDASSISEDVELLEDDINTQVRSHVHESYRRKHELSTH